MDLGRLVLLSTLLPTLLVSAATPAIAFERRSVGIALGGGSARGIAHVGVLEWLEENRIPVDFIAGTSMGGLVGGAYATGMLAPEIRALLRDNDWNRTFLGEAPYSSKQFRRKEDRRDFPVWLELGLKHGIRAPSGLDPAHGVGLLLSRIGFPHSNDLDFDELSVPFRCVATDMNHARMVVLDRGSFPQALLATMAIPGVFPLIERDGQTLGDGGLTNNVPADVVRGMGADVVIGVDVGYVSDGSHLDAFAQASRAIDVMMRTNTRRSLDYADVILRPDLEEVGAFDWRRSDEIADVGYRSVEQAADTLLDLSLNESEWKEHLDTRATLRVEARFVPQLIVVEGTDADQAARIERRLEHHVGTEVDLTALGEDLTWLTGTDRFDRIRYEAARLEGRNALRIIAREKYHAPPFVRFGVDITNETGDVGFNFGSRLTALDVGKTGAELRTDIALGLDLGAGVEYYWPFARNRLFFAPRGFFFRRSRNVFDQGELVATLRDRSVGAAADIGVTSGRASEIRLGYRKRSGGFPTFSGATSTHSLCSRWEAPSTISTPPDSARASRVASSSTRYSAHY